MSTAPAFPRPSLRAWVLSVGVLGVLLGMFAVSVFVLWRLAGLTWLLPVWIKAPAAAALVAFGMRFLSTDEG